MIVAKEVNLISSKESSESDISEEMTKEYLQEKEVIVEKVITPVLEVDDDMVDME
jgi:hypothetical protein